MTYDCDLFVIGAGSGGVRAARMAAALGARVMIAEDRFLGGTCVNVGCIPKKLLVYAAGFADDLAVAPGYGWTLSGDFDWPTLIANKDREIERLNGIYRNLLSSSGAELIEARAKLVGPHEVEVDGRVLSARDILVATGGWPYLPDVPGIEHAITSNEAFYLEELPRRIVVAGGGYIAVELAGVFARLGVETTLLYRAAKPLRGFDDDVRDALIAEMESAGIAFHLNAIVTAIERDDSGLDVQLSDGAALACDEILFAVGRWPNTQDLGLEQLGVELDERGAIQVNPYSQTSVPSVWAIGDVTDRLALTPVAIHEAMCLVRTLFQDEPTAPDHELVATAVFSQPPIGTVGMTEEEARVEHDVEVYRSTFRPLKLTLTDLQERTMMKLVVDRESRRILGAHMLGADAGEIIQGVAIAVKMGATKEDFDRTIGIHPTSAEEFVTMREPVS